MTRILLIEDEIELRTMMYRLLTRESYLVAEAEDGRSAIIMLAREPFDLVITDILMPETDGMEVIQTVRRLQPQTRILAMSGGGRNSSDLYLAMAARIGAHKVLAKPFAPEALLRMVRELVWHPAD